MLELLIDRIRNNNPISDNAMLGGLVIGFIISTESFTRSLILGEEIGRVLDGTMQKLEQIVLWIDKNEEELCSIF